MFLDFIYLTDKRQQAGTSHLLQNFIRPHKHIHTFELVHANSHNLVTLYYFLFFTHGLHSLPLCTCRSFTVSVTHLMSLSPTFAFLREVPVSRQTSPPMACHRLSPPQPISSSLLGQNYILFVSFSTSATESKSMRGTEMKSVSWKHPKWHQCPWGERTELCIFWLQAHSSPGMFEDISLISFSDSASCGSVLGWNHHATAICPHR